MEKMIIRESNINSKEEAIKEFPFMAKLEKEDFICLFMGITKLLIAKDGSIMEALKEML
jgi:hypothetical protein